MRKMRENGLKQAFPRIFLHFVKFAESNITNSNIPPLLTKIKAFKLPENEKFTYFLSKIDKN